MRKQWLTLFLGVPKSLQMVTAAMKLKDDAASNVVTKAYVDALHIDGLVTDADKKKLGAIAINGTAQGNIPSASSLGNYSTAVGASASASGNYSTAMGYSAFATNSAVAFGRGATATEAYATAFGYQSSASANSAMALGRGANATAGGAVQIGLGENSKNNTLQFKDYTLLESNGKIPFERLNVGTTSNTVASGDSVLNAIATAEAYTDALVNETNETFAAAVAAVSPPVVLPQKWALANVTNAQGGAVTAGDVGAVARDANYLSVSNSALSALQPASLTNYYTKGQVDTSLSAKADKVTDGYAGELVTVDANGNLVGSGNHVEGLFGCPELYVAQVGTSYPATSILPTGLIRYDWDECIAEIALPATSGTLALESDLAAAALAATNYTDSAIRSIDVMAGIAATNTVFSNAVLAVGLNIDTNTVAAINALVEAGDELPIGGAATVGGLLLALAAAVAALARKIYYTSAAQSASNNAITLSERTFNTLDATALTGSITVTLPAAPSAQSGKVADVLLRVDTGADVPTLVFDETANVFIAADDTWATLEASSHNVFSFTSAGTYGTGNAAKRVWVVGRVTSAIAGGV